MLNNIKKEIWISNNYFSQMWNLGLFEGVFLFVFSFFFLANITFGNSNHYYQNYM